MNAPLHEEPRPLTGSSPSTDLGQDMQKLQKMLRTAVAPHLKRKAQARILDLACGRCDEAETLLTVVKEQTQTEAVQLIGADIRIREIRQARERLSGKNAEFLIQDATQLHQHQQLGTDFDLVFLRHQNYWHGPSTWQRIFEQGINKLADDGLLVITSYFDKEHQLALQALQKQGAQLLLSQRNDHSRSLADAPGKSVDRWIAVLKKPST